MPELPEVEVTQLGITPHVLHQIIDNVVIRQHKLRYPINPQLPIILYHQKIERITRRAKYLILHFEQGILVIHLGMSGSLRIILPNNINRLPEKHDHVDFTFSNSTILRYHDPRRFGMIDWFTGKVEDYPHFKNLGVEPLSDAFNLIFLHKQLQKYHSNIKTVLMNGKIVVGIGNIYANEALFRSGIHPEHHANTITKASCKKLTQEIKLTLQQAIEAGGSTLRDFIHSDGSTGYFQQNYFVYGRENQPCFKCGTMIIRQTITQRSSFFCPHCQQ